MSFHTKQYMNYLQERANAVVKTLQEKDKAYGGSWLKRGGTGAFMMLARKWDRLENQSEAQGFDIFKAVLQDHGVVDDIDDLIGYLLLVRAEIRVRAIHDDPNLRVRSEPMADWSEEERDLPYDVEFQQATVRTGRMQGVKPNFCALPRDIKERRETGFQRIARSPGGVTVEDANGKLLYAGHERRGLTHPVDILEDITGLLFPEARASCDELIWDGEEQRLDTQFDTEYLGSGSIRVTTPSGEDHYVGNDRRNVLVVHRVDTEEGWSILEDEDRRTTLNTSEHSAGFDGCVVVVRQSTSDGSLSTIYTGIERRQCNHLNRRSLDYWHMPDPGGCVTVYEKKPEFPGSGKVVYQGKNRRVGCQPMAVDRRADRNTRFILQAVDGHIQVQLNSNSGEVLYEGQDRRHD